MNLGPYWYVVFGVIVVLIVALVRVLGSRVPSARESELPAGALPPGWQFYSNPTTLEPPGTVFRIDPDKQRYIVDSLNVAIQSGEEAVGRVEESVAAITSMAAQFLGLPTVKASVGAQQVEHFAYEITNPVMEVVSDVELEKSLPAFLAGHPFRRDSRYFVIRQARKASAMRYKLTRKQINKLGGEASVGRQLSAQGKVFSSERSGAYVLEQDFKTPMRVVFLPEEIKPVTAGLAAEKPRLGLVPVREPLRWEDAPEDHNARA